MNLAISFGNRREPFAFKITISKLNLAKTKVIVSRGITKNGPSRRKAYPCGVSSLKVKTQLRENSAVSRFTLDVLEIRR